MTSDHVRIQAAVHASGDIQETMMEAADEIDRLAKRVAELESELSRLCDVLGEDDVAIVRTLIEGFRDMRDRDAATEIVE